MYYRDNQYNWLYYAPTEITVPHDMMVHLALHVVVLLVPMALFHVFASAHRSLRNPKRHRRKLIHTHIEPKFFEEFEWLFQVTYVLINYYVVWPLLAHLYTVELSAGPV
jgi:hypothetical protein